MSAGKMKATVLILGLAWMLAWAIPVAGALAEHGAATILDDTGGPTPVYAFEGPGLTGIIEAQLPWHSFVPMDERAQSEVVAKLGAIADDYDLIGRVSLDGQYGYITGVLKAGHDPAAEGRGASDRLSDGAYVFYNADSPGSLILVPEAYARAKGFGLEYYELYSLVTNGDIDYLRDVIRRGVLVCAPPVPYLSVYLLENGQHRYEYIRLTEEDLKNAASGGYVFKAGSLGVAISLVTSEAEAEYGNGTKSIPASLYAMAAERCGFTVASPKDIGTIVRASITVSHRGQSRIQVVEDKTALKKLASILKSAKKTNLGNCPYTGVLTMVMKDGRVVTVQKATDSCRIFVFGSAMGYEIDAKADKQFRQIFQDAFPILPK